jgi:hypothetical protein
LYPIGADGTRLKAYLNKKEAITSLKAVSKHDKFYVRERGGLHLESVTATRYVLTGMGLGVG